MGYADSYLVVDIETIPDTSVWARNENPGKFPPTYAHRILVIGCMWLDSDLRLKKLGVVGEHSDESGLLEEFSRFVEKNRPVLITFNGRTFDMPVLAQRSLGAGVPMPWYYQDRGVRYRFSEDGHIDLCDWLAEHGAVRSASLDSMARLIGLPGKLDIDGSQVEGLYNAGQLQTIENYCLMDVTQTALLFLRFRLLQGILSKEEYERKQERLLADLRSDERIAPLLDAMGVPYAPEIAA